MKTTLAMRLGTALGTVLIGLAPAAQALATSTWGPARTPLTYNGVGTIGTDTPVFNSFTNTPVYGDERTFFDGKTTDFTTNGGYRDSVDVNGKSEVLVRVYVHNNADPSKNGTSLLGAGVATNAKVKVTLPTTNGRSAVANAFISADNAAPKEVFDSMDFVTSGASGFSLEYEKGSAKIYNNASLTGRPVDDSIVTTGAAIGYDKNDGRVPGCFQYASYITLKLKVHASQVTIAKTVGVPGSGKLQQELAGEKAGDTVSWIVAYKNESAAQVNNAIIRDQLPAHLTVVPGSVKMYDGNYPTGLALSDTGLFTTGGVNIGSIAGGGGSGYIKYQTTIKTDLSCGANPMTNNVWIKADNSAETSDWARVIATQICAGSAVCSKLDGTKDASGLVWNFNVTASASNTSITNYLWDFGDGTTADTKTSPSTAHTFAIAKLPATVKVSVKTEDGKLTAGSCTMTITAQTSTPQLPDTGAEGLATGLFGTGALGYGVNAYLKSKRGLASALRAVAGK
jgi:uncharacterized repeat protein (TIGR01451 family)